VRFLEAVALLDQRRLGMLRDRGVQAFSAASRYFSIKNDALCSASPTLSNPLAAAVDGQHFLQLEVDARRSRMVFPYSTRLSRRRTTRPSARRAASAACTSAAIQSDSTRISASGGPRLGLRRHLAQSDPLLATVCQRSRLARSAKSGARVSRRKSPLGFLRPGDSPGSASQGTARTLRVVVLDVRGL